jgi:hypothetical protein
MALAQVYTAVAGDTITAARWNNEFGNIYTNGTDVSFPLTKAVSFAGFTITLDAAGVTTLISSATQGFSLTPGNKAGTPGLNGSFLNLVASTFTDTDTAGSGTATQFSGTTFRAPTLVATNSLVVTTDAATVVIENAPTAGANETLTNAWALRVIAGKTRLGGDVSIGGNSTLAGTLTATGKSVWFAEGASVASAATADIWTTDGNTVHITGTVTITSLGTAPQAGAFKLVIFDDALTLTHGANVNLPGAVNLTTAAGDMMLVYADSTTQFDIMFYTRASGLGIVAPAASQGSSLVFIETLTASASASLVFTDLGSTYAEHVFQLTDILPATATVDLFVNISIDNGAAFGNSGYEQSLSGTSSALISNWNPVVNQITTSTSGINGAFHLYNPHTTGKKKVARWQLSYETAADGLVDSTGVGNAGDNSPDVVNNAVNALRFQFSSGNIASGTIRHYGIKNS